jgi:hypothetical protein
VIFFGTDFGLGLIHIDRERAGLPFYQPRGDSDSVLPEKPLACAKIFRGSGRV